mgnify:FL=1|tara:strand:+ start:487 stop:930 length:444 start_codon:yes stop_codon:yes gene_type:complete
MTHLDLFEKRFVSPLDVLVKNFFDKDAIFDKPSRQAIPHPLDIYEDEEGITFEIACVGLTKNDIDISIEDDTLKVSYKKDENKTPSGKNKSLIHYHYSGVKKSSFDFGWKVARRFNLSKAEAEMVNGLLCITIPISSEAKPKTLQIK